MHGSRDARERCPHIRLCFGPRGLDNAPPSAGWRLHDGGGGVRDRDQRIAYGTRCEADGLYSCDKNSVAVPDLGARIWDPRGPQLMNWDVSSRSSHRLTLLPLLSSRSSGGALKRTRSCSAGLASKR